MILKGDYEDNSLNAANPAKVVKILGNKLAYFEISAEVSFAMRTRQSIELA